MQEALCALCASLCFFKKMDLKQWIEWSYEGGSARSVRKSCQNWVLKRHPLPGEMVDGGSGCGGGLLGEIDASN